MVVPTASSTGAGAKQPLTEKNNDSEKQQLIDPDSLKWRVRARVVSWLDVLVTAIYAGILLAMSLFSYLMDPKVAINGWTVFMFINVMAIQVVVYAYRFKAIYDLLQATKPTNSDEMIDLPQTIRFVNKWRVACVIFIIIVFLVSFKTWPDIPACLPQYGAIVVYTIFFLVVGQYQFELCNRHEKTAAAAAAAEEDDKDKEEQP